MKNLNLKPRLQNIDKRFIAAGVAALLFIAACFAYAFTPKEIPTLTVGVFAGSNWNVPQGESYALIDATIKKFEETHPGVRVVYESGIKREDYGEWLAEQYLQGTEPDVFLLLEDDFNLYASMGALMDLSGLMESDEDFDENNYYPAAFRYGVYDGDAFALPMDSIMTLMFVNKTLLAKENIPLPDSAWTWQDFYNICQKVTKDTDGDGVLDQFGCYDYSWEQAAVTNGVLPFKEDGQACYFADSRMEDTIRFMMALKALNRGQEPNSRDFDAGRVAFRPFTFAEYRAYKPYPWRIKKYGSFEWDCITMPAGPHGDNVSVFNTLLVAMSARTQKRSLAWDYMKLLCYDREMQELILQKPQALPARRDVVLSTEAKKIFLWDSEGSAMTPQNIDEAMNSAIMNYRFPRYRTAMLYADREIQKIIDGVTPPVNALNKLQKEINAFLQK